LFDPESGENSLPTAVDPPASSTAAARNSGNGELPHDPASAMARRRRQYCNGGGSGGGGSMAALPPRSGGTAGEGGWEAAASSAARRGGELGGASLAMGTEEEKKERRKGGRSEGGRGCVGRGKRWGERVPSPVLPHGLTGLTAAKRKRDADGGEREVAGERAYSSSEVVEEELERELAEVPLGELQKARADGSHVPSLKKLREEKKLRRLNKNRRPMEMSSKVPVGRLREVIQAPKKVN
ncbi:hypothetical protein Taro_021351, partial [Colocasia esculenta]|nr:hypothetical protein [Colocasia esculenta]